MGSCKLRYRKPQAYCFPFFKWRNFWNKKTKTMKKSIDETFKKVVKGSWHLKNLLYNHSHKLKRHKPKPKKTLWKQTSNSASQQTKEPSNSRLLLQLSKTQSVNSSALNGKRLMASFGSQMGMFSDSRHLVAILRKTQVKRIIWSFLTATAFHLPARKEL